MQEITATDAARRFSALLSAVERDGETFLLTRGGRVVARIQPAAAATGRSVKELLYRHHSRISATPGGRGARMTWSSPRQRWPTTE